MKKKTIFFLSPEVTGAERVTITLAKGLAKEKKEVVYAIIGKTFGEIVSYIPDGSFQHLVPLSKLEDFLIREKPDAVFCSLIHLNGHVLTSAHRVGNIEVILRNNYKLKDVSEELLTIAKDCYPKADIVIAQTEEMKQELIKVCGVKESNIKVIDNPIDTEYIDFQVKGIASPYPDDGNIHLCWVGRYERIKGVDIMLEAFMQAYQRNSKLSLYLIGKTDEGNDYYQKMVAFIQINGLNEMVHIMGFQTNPYIWMAHADAFLIPSRSEANSNVFKEATYLGVHFIYNNKVKEIAEQILQIKHNN